MHVKSGSTDAPLFNDGTNPSIAANLNDNHYTKENDMTTNNTTDISFASRVRALDEQGCSVSTIRDIVGLKGDPNGYRKVYGVLNHAKYAKASRANGTRKQAVRGPEDMTSDELAAYLANLQAVLEARKAAEEEAAKAQTEEAAKKEALLARLAELKAQIAAKQPTPAETVDEVLEDLNVQAAAEPTVDEEFDWESVSPSAAGPSDAELMAVEKEVVEL
jgi:hypothetical protein